MIQAATPSHIAKANNQRATMLVVCLLIALVCLVVAAVCRAWLLSLPVLKVEVSGNLKHLNTADVKQKMLPLVDAGMLSLEAETLRAVLLQDAWIDDASVRKQWPDKVVITVYEQNPVAYWQEDALINHRGEVFKPRQIPADKPWPRLFGATDEGEAVFDVYSEINTVLGQRGMAIKALYKSELGTYRARLKHGLELVFDEQAPDQQLQKFVSVYDQYLAQGKYYVAAIDLRYTNGLAVAWHSPAVNQTQSLTYGERNEG